ncbi:alkaline phosphatase family protein [Actinacidiphila rubida]|uniref:alkaline phosphatase family protein n=1 Tax=Actinacidiphila rubida TaxID=310780 RepID=UPI0015A516C6|nr:alkaline phosphatase family protein [Actinacidiphila rubida]
MKLREGRAFALVIGLIVRARLPSFDSGTEQENSGIDCGDRGRADRRPLMSATDGSHGLDHVVVLMFENRSFDNLLGQLYQPGEVAAFEGVLGKDLSNPIPGWAEEHSGHQIVPYGTAETMDTPNPDPGEEYPHVNTQLFGVIDPESNRGVLAEDMAAPFNTPRPGRAPTMDGFVTDYISAFRAELGRQPKYREYAQIMAGYTSEQMPVLSTLARGFATFDHWFAEVPSQTFTNRSFFHAASASGFVVNAPYRTFPLHNNAETVFERLEANGLTWRVYVDAPSSIPFTGLIHGPRLRRRFATHFVTVDRFLEDAAAGTLPTYAFIEPNLWHGHNDMHPPESALLHGMPFDAPSSLLGGEALLAEIYGAVRSSNAPEGSNAFNTLLMVVFDEHGGTYDHIAPPRAVPPEPGAPAGQMGFAFDRLGVRLPAIAISAWVPERTVVNHVHHHTSVIRTLRERWNLGPPLTARDADAPDLSAILSLDRPRDPQDWPDIAAQAVPAFDQDLVPPDAPLNPLATALFHGYLALVEQMGASVPQIDERAPLKGQEAMAIVHESAHTLFPGLRPPMA